MRFNKRYFEAVLSGEKRVTVRWNEQVSLGPATFVFEDHPDNPQLDGEVLTVERYGLEGLTAEQAKMPDGADIGALISGLRGHYPEMPDDAEVDVVTFTTASRP